MPTILNKPDLEKNDWRKAIKGVSKILWTLDVVLFPFACWGGMPVPLAIVYIAVVVVFFVSWEIERMFTKK